MITMESARHIAARIWCDPEYSHMVMDTDLAEAIAEMLHLHARRSDVVVREAIDFLFDPANDDVPAGELRKQVVEKFGVDVNNVIAKLLAGGRY